MYNNITRHGSKPKKAQIVHEILYINQDTELINYLHGVYSMLLRCKMHIKGIHYMCNSAKENFNKQNDCGTKRTVK